MQREPRISRDSIYYSTFGWYRGLAFKATVCKEESINICQLSFLYKFHQYLVRKDGHHLRKSSDFYKDYMVYFFKIQGGAIKVTVHRETQSLEGYLHGLTDKILLIGK